MTLKARQEKQAAFLATQGCKMPRTVVLEAARAGMPLSYALAFLQKESTGRDADGSVKFALNLFGQDRVENPVKGGFVTHARYDEYLAGRRRGLGMQGVGPMQLTWYEFQDHADRLGGCWKPQCNIRVGFGIAKALIQQHGKQEGAARFNGVGDDAERYGSDWLDKQRHWHQLLEDVGTNAPAGPPPGSTPHNGHSATFSLKRPHMRGDDVHAFQAELNFRYAQWDINKRIVEDHDYGPKTRDAAHEVCACLGIALPAKAPITPALRTKIRRPETRTPDERQRGNGPEATALRAKLRRAFATTDAGVELIDGVQVAAWIVPSLLWARAHGWNGKVVSGYRDCAHQMEVAKAFAVRQGKTVAQIYPAGPCASNHVGIVHPRGAVDVTLPQQLNDVLRGSPHRPGLVWAGPVIGDVVHFSADGH